MRPSISGDPGSAGWRSLTRALKALEDENRKLKKLLAETMLDASTLKEMLAKNF
jgi:putative transposase